jgi:hypothetical protein
MCQVYQCQLISVQFCDNTHDEATTARDEVGQIILTLAERFETELTAYRDLLTSIRETRHLGSFAIPAHVKAALELCEEQLAATQAKEG